MKGLPEEVVPELSFEEWAVGIKKSNLPYFMQKMTGLDMSYK